MITSYLLSTDKLHFLILICTSYYTDISNALINLVYNQV